MPQGVGPAALKGARALGTTSPGTPERVSFILKAQHLQQLEFSVESGMHDGYLSVSQFAEAYGQPAANVSALESYLAQYKITTQAYADRLDVSATGTVGEFDQALGIQQKDYFVPAVPASNGQMGIPAQRIHGTTQPATLPGPIARNVLAILGLTSYSSFVSNLVHTPKAAPSATMNGTVSSSQTPEDFAKNYGLDPLYAKGFDGTGQTIGIVTLASVNPEVPYYFWRNTLGMKVPAGRITLTNVDGGAGPVSLNAWIGRDDAGRRAVRWAGPGGARSTCTRRPTPTPGSPTPSSTPPARTWPTPCR